MSTTLVLGATGRTGRRVAARLRPRGTPVRAASRSGPTPSDRSDPGGWGEVPEPFVDVEDDAHHVAEAVVLVERGALAAATDDVATVLGRPPRTVEDDVVRAAAAGAWR